MAHLVLTDTDILLGGVDLSGDTNNVAVEYTAEDVDDTNFASAGWRARLPGLTDVSASLDGAVDLASGGSDEHLFSKVGVADTELTVTPVARAAGGVAFMTRHMVGAYTPGGAVGERFNWSASLMATSAPFVRGTVVEPGLTSRTTSGNSSGQQIGAVTSAQSVYAALHVLTAGGTSLDATVESDDNAGFTSATTRLTFDTVTSTVGSQWQSLAGAVTDDYWRVTWALGASGPYLFVVTVGIG